MNKETVFPLIDCESPECCCEGQQSADWERIKPLVEAVVAYHKHITFGGRHCFFCDATYPLHRETCSFKNIASALAGSEGPQTATAIVIREAAGERDAIRKEMEKP